MGRSCLVVPVKVQKEVVGLLVVMRAAENPFSPSNQAMVEALSDYASISLVNARLFEAVEKRAQSLQKAVERSKASEHLMAEILRNASARLRTPVTQAGDKLQALLEAPERDLSSDQTQALEDIQTDMQAICTVVEALAALEKASAPQELTTLNLVDLARQAAKRFKAEWDGRKVELQTEYPDTPFWVSVDLEQIAQVFDALLSNAIQFSGSGGVISLRVGSGSDGMAIVAIHDHGPGIAVEHQEHIFDPFYQFDQHEDAGGLGVGLTLAREIIQAHGGNMWVKSQPGSGATFYFTLQLAKQ